jgi:23S rRNA pseudouridine2457 synthase
VYAAGRLDRDSEGLLLLTDDRGLVRQITDPQNKVTKTYWVMVEGLPAPDKLAKLAQGVRIRDHLTRPAQVRVIPEPDLPPRSKPVTPHGPTAWLEVKLGEGKKRQIRHMTASVGLFTVRLVRVAIGEIRLGDLKPGEFRKLSRREVYAGLLGEQREAMN